MKKNVLVAVMVLVVLGGGIGYYLYQKPTEKSVSAVADTTVTAEALLAAFQADEAKAMATYAHEGKVVQVTGKVRSIDTSDPTKVNVLLETGDALAAVVCEFEPAHAPAWAEGTSASVKGICTGMLLDVVITRCAAVE